MEPIPETLEALEELDRYDDGDLVEHLTATADRARTIAPGLVGVSIGSREHGVTFTLVATDEEIATLDAVQYVATGPCVDAIDLGRGLASSPGGLLDEREWHDFARASAAAGIHSTLTFPVVQAGDVIATVNLYGDAADTFQHKHAELATAFGAWAPGAVTNADLSFSTRNQAEQAPVRLAERAWLDQATGVIAAQRGSSLPEARAQLEDAALRAGVPVIRLARVVLGLHDERPDQ
ncbi:ANTAR domain-containing protein [Nocardioides sp. GCM10028917]|uniref:GAF and ANTAR domain-containing protein n=1 Tax=Nocardioides sp. GCM10028917 TaxID=3273408 RepID=UPI00360E4F44